MSIGGSVIVTRIRCCTEESSHSFATNAFTMFVCKSSTASI